MEEEEEEEEIPAIYTLPPASLSSPWVPSSNWAAFLLDSLSTATHISQPVYRARLNTLISGVWNPRLRDVIGPRKERITVSHQHWPREAEILWGDFKQWPFRQSLWSHPVLPRTLTAADSLKENLENQRKIKVL
jgi:hypothetical protein